MAHLRCLSFAFAPMAQIITRTLCTLYKAMLFCFCEWKKRGPPKPGETVSHCCHLVFQLKLWSCTYRTSKWGCMDEASNHWCRWGEMQNNLLCLLYLMSLLFYTWLTRIHQNTLKCRKHSQTKRATPLAARHQPKACNILTQINERQTGWQRQGI